MSMNNPFHHPAFSLTALTAAINLLPNQYGRLEELNLFPIKPVRFRQVCSGARYLKSICAIFG